MEAVESVKKLRKERKDLRRAWVMRVIWGGVGHLVAVTVVGLLLMVSIPRWAWLSDPKIAFMTTIHWFVFLEMAVAAVANRIYHAAWIRETRELELRVVEKLKRARKLARAHRVSAQ